MTDASNNGPAGPQAGRVGDILRREREKRQISVEAVAKKLKLHASYIEAIETDDYGKLPGDTYIRVYLKSLCGFFSLNVEEILERFFQERGVTGVDTLRKDSHTKINLAVPEKEKPNTTLIVALGLLAALAVFSLIANRHEWWSSQKAGARAEKTQAVPLDSVKAGKRAEAETRATDSVKTVLSALPSVAVADTHTTAAAATARPRQIGDTARQKGGSARAAPAPGNTSKDLTKKSKDAATPASAAPRPAAPASPAAPDTDTAEKAAAPAPGNTSKDLTKKSKDAAAPASAAPRSAAPASPAAPDKDTAGKSAAPAPKPGPEPDSAVPARDSARKSSSPVPAHPGAAPMKLRVTVTGDSCWIRVFSDGKPWRKTLGRSRVRSFTARDSFNVLVGVSGAVSFTLDGRPVEFPGRNIKAFRVDRSGVTPWALDKWNDVFKDRP